MRPRPDVTISSNSVRREPLRAVPDLAGTPVVDAVGFPIGSVFGSLVEADSGLIRYLDLALEKPARHVLVPIGHARLIPGEDDDEATRVRLRAATLEDLGTVPPFEPAADPDDAMQDRLLDLHGRVFYGQRYYAHPAFDHEGLYAGPHAILRGPHMPVAVTDEVRPLSALEDLRVAEDEPDIRGWPLHLADGPAGRVEELLVSPAALRVRYAVIRLGDGRAVPLPVGYLAVGDEGTVVRATGLEPEDLAALPEFDADGFDAAAEARVRAALESRLTGGRRFARADFAPPRGRSD